MEAIIIRRDNIQLFAALQCAEKDLFEVVPDARHKDISSANFAQADQIDSLSFAQ